MQSWLKWWKRKLDVQLGNSVLKYSNLVTAALFHDDYHFSCDWIARQRCHLMSWFSGKESCSPLNERKGKPLNFLTNHLFLNADIRTAYCSVSIRLKRLSVSQWLDPSTVFRQDLNEQVQLECNLEWWMLMLLPYYQDSIRFGCIIQVFD